MAKKAEKKHQDFQGVCADNNELSLVKSGTVDSTASTELSSQPLSERLELDVSRQRCGMVDSEIGQHLHSFLASVVATAQVARHSIDTPQAAAETSAKLNSLCAHISRQRSTAKALTRLLSEGATLHYPDTSNSESLVTYETVGKPQLH